MARCIHFHDAGVQCISQALPESAFCEDHEPVEELYRQGGEALPGHPLRKLLLRLIALILLLMLLVPFYRVARTLYLSPSFGVAGRP